MFKSLRQNVAGAVVEGRMERELKKEEIMRMFEEEDKQKLLEVIVDKLEEEQHKKEEVPAEQVAAERKVYIEKETPEQIKKIVEKHKGKEEAAMAINLKDIKQKIVLWNTLFPMVQPYYAVKCNPNPQILNILAKSGAYFDCASPAEIKMVKNVQQGNLEKVDVTRNEQQQQGMVESESMSSLSSLSTLSNTSEENDMRETIFEPSTHMEKIIYANPCKTRGAIRVAKQQNVKWLVVDSVEELIKVNEEYAEAKIFIRILVDDSTSLCQFGKKFGLNPESNELEAVLDEAKKRNMYIEGVSFHVGSGCSSAEAYRGALTHVRNVFEKAKRKGIDTLRVVDIGGGFPGDNMILLNQISNVVQECIDTLFDEQTLFMAEPGRYFVTTSHTLICQIGTKKCIDGVTRYYLNDGVYCSLNNILHDHYEPVLSVVNGSTNLPTHKASMFGPTCDSIDTIFTNVDMPILELDSYIYFENMGAYTSAAGTNFNGFDFPSLYYYD